LKAQSARAIVLPGVVTGFSAGAKPETEQNREPQLELDAGAAHWKMYNR